MSPELIAMTAIGVALVILIGIGIYRKLPKRVKTGEYVDKWRSVQKMCRNKNDWAHAVIHADMLLDEVLQNKKVTGKTLGERLVNVEKQFSDKESVWSAHKLSNSLRKDSDVKLTKNQVKKTLIAFRTALKDIKAL